MVEKKVYQELGLSDQEYQEIQTILKRDPSSTELAMFSVEWSEHCGYPSSRNWLKLFPQTGKYETLVTEDAGGFVYDNLAIVFKMESHNHPSQIEPKQGAATGVGGIIRDIFTTGARPIATLNSLRFGELSDPYNRYLLGGVVDGIQMYGNCLGVPTVGGEIYFEDAYSGNCLVNVMAVGIAEREDLARARAEGVGNSIMYVGSRTGRDGIGGCSVLASAEFSAEEQKRPTVQIGDPFTEKCLIEATLEALKTGHVRGIKDMGAAGLTCSTAEMAAEGGVGMEVDLEKVPLREEGMEPYEIMMSESQERMLVCVEKGKEAELRSVFTKWGLEAEVIGKVVNEDKLVISYHGEVVADLSPQNLTNAPVYNIAFEEPAYLKEVNQLDLSEIKEPDDLNEVVLKLLSSPNICSRVSIFEQYDHMVQINTAVLPGSDAALLRVKGRPFGLAVTSDCNGRYCYLDPFKGAQIALAEACRNLVCVGADPAAVTDCLNFANPGKPDRFWHFKRAVEGLSDACKFFNLPVVSGNVSFYNESHKGPIYPTPTIGMVGIVKDIKKHVTAAFKDEGDLIVLLGITHEELGGSEYLKVTHDKVQGLPPTLDLSFEKKVQDLTLKVIEEGLVKSAHDLSEGGLAVTLSESVIHGKVGAAINLSDQAMRSDILLFSESQSRIILTLKPENTILLSELAEKAGVPLTIIGKVGGERLTINQSDKDLVHLSLEELNKAYFAGF